MKEVRLNLIKKKIVISFALSLSIALLTFIIYFNLLSSDFLSIDDPVYVTENPYVNKGVTIEGISWALDFGHETGPYWMPLTMLSHMIDCQLFGLDPSRHHLTSLIIHIINAILLFIFFYKITGALWKSALISVLFAVHPLNVESVAWITSRKNVLNTFFWLTTMLLYLRYIDKKELGAYLSVLLCFFAGIMTKPAIITLTFSLLLLDMWPLNRFILFKKNEKRLELQIFSKRNIKPLVEKIPFLILTAIILIMNFSVDNFFSEATSLTEVPLSMRLSNAFVAIIIYMGKLILPFNLSVFYPYPISIPLWQTAGSVSFFLFMVFFSIRYLKRFPWVFTGWFWFTGNLVMVSGIIQGGYWPAYADRFTYIPQLGFFVLVLWAAESLLTWSFKNANFYKTAVALSLLVIGFLSVLTYRQVQYWESGIKLYSHALQINSDDVVSKVNLAFALDRAGETEKAIRYYKEVIRLYPDYWQAHSNLGVALSGMGENEEAFFHLKEALRVNPGAEKALYNAGVLYKKKDMPDKALESFIRAHKINSRNFEACFNAGRIYEDKKMFREALDYYKKAKKLNPDHVELNKQMEIVSQANDLVDIALEKIMGQLKLSPADPVLLVKAGNIYRILGMMKEAEEFYIKGRDADPLNPKALSGMAEIYIHRKEYDRAIAIYKKILKEKPKYKLSLYYNIACVYSLKNEKATAVRWLKKAVDGGFSRWDIITSENQFDNIRETDYFNRIENIAEQSGKKN